MYPRMLSRLFAWHSIDSLQPWLLQLIDFVLHADGINVLSSKISSFSFYNEAFSMPFSIYVYTIMYTYSDFVS